MLYSIQLRDITAGICTDEAGMVVSAAPVFRWMMGKHFDFIRTWIIKKGGNLTMATTESS